MKLKTALNSVIELKGFSILKNSLVINLLNDFNGFSDYPSSRNVLKFLINEGIMEKILFAHSSGKGLETQTQSYINELQNKLGVREDIASYVINSIISSLGYNVDKYNQVNITEQRDPQKSNSLCNKGKHLTFKGIEINGTAYAICKKLRQKGFPDSAKMDFGYALKGTFAGKECNVLIYESTHTGNVWRIAVCFAPCYSWDILKVEYFRIKKILIGNYGEPEVSVERILPPYKDGDGNELLALAKGKGECQSVFVQSNGRIHLAIGVDESDNDLGRIILFYDDTINYQLNEEAETASDINQYSFENNDFNEEDSLENFGDEDFEDEDFEDDDFEDDDFEDDDFEDDDFEDDDFEDDDFEDDDMDEYEKEYGENVIMEDEQGGIYWYSGKVFQHAPEGVNTYSLREGTEVIESYPFYPPQELEYIDIPGSVKTIKFGAFASCERLTQIYLPQGLENIGEGCFSHCEMLQDITIPSKVKSIEPDTFFSCVSLKNVNLSKHLSCIKESAFSWCESLNNIIIPKNVKSIGDSAFEGCESLNNITFQGIVTEIGSNVFNYCASRIYVKVPKGSKRYYKDLLEESSYGNLDDVTFVIKEF